MKALALITYTDCEPKHRSLAAAGHEVHVLQYDDRPHERHGELVDAARRLAPDFVMMVGAIEQYHGRPVPRPDVLCAIKQVAPFIHMCDDAGDPPWWPMLEVYEREKCFTVQVSIDGAPGTPIDRFENGMVLLTPIDHRPFHPLPWTERGIRLGMVGGFGHSRRAEITEGLRSRGLLDFREGPVGRSYDEMAAVMCQTKITYNFGMTGSTAAMHVKGRVVEAGFAGCALLEFKGSPTSRWFTPGIDYIEFGSVDEVAEILERTPDEDLRRMARGFHAKMTAAHHPAVFWSKVLERAGVGP